MIRFNVKKPKWIHILIGVIGFLVLLVTISSLFYILFTWPIRLGEAFDFCLEFSEKSTLNKIIITFLFILIALLLYIIKKSVLLIFGVIEFVGGVFIIWGTLISPSSDKLVNAIALGAGLFLMVKGAENYSDGNAQEEERKKTKSNKLQKNDHR